MSELTHIVVDVETLDMIETAVVLSIALVPFCFESGENSFPYFLKRRIKN